MIGVVGRFAIFVQTTPKRHGTANNSTADLYAKEDLLESSTLFQYVNTEVENIAS